MTPMLNRLLIFAIVCLLLCTANAWSNDARQAVRAGNSLYKEGRYAEAEIAYRKALEADQQNVRAWFNLGNALYRQGRNQEAAEIFDRLSVTADNDAYKAASFHNKGNALLKEQQFAESADAYKNALRLNPDDEVSRYNLAYAMQFLEDPPPQEDSSDGEDEQDQQDQNDQTEPDQQPQADQDKQAASPEQLSVQEAERLLDAMNQREQNVQENVKREEQTGLQRKVEKEW